MTIHPPFRASGAMTRKERQIGFAILTGKPVEQVAALPWRNARFGSTQAAGREVLLITSRRRGRLILPKGWPMKKRTRFEAAEIEAWQEAGVVGTIETQPIGRFETTKRIGTSDVPLLVTVYPLKVKSVLPKWKEADQRTRLWVPAEDAAVSVDDRGLSDLLCKIF